MAKKNLDNDLLTGGAKLSAADSKKSKKSTNKKGVSKKVQKAIKAVVAVVIVAALLVTYVATGLVRHGFFAYTCIPAEHFTGITVVAPDGKKIKTTIGEYNYYFALTYNNLQSQQKQYEQNGIDLKDVNLDVDFDKKLSKQKTKNDDGQEVTWLEYVKEQAIDSLKSTEVYYYEAVKANKNKEPEITEDQQKEINDTINQYKTTANSYGYTTSAYLRKALGDGVTESLFREQMKKSYIAQAYQEELEAEHNHEEPTEEELAEYKKENPEECKTVSIRLFEATNEDDAKAFKKALKADGSNFSELASKYADDSFDKTNFKEDGFTTELYATREILKAKQYAIATADKKDADKFPGLDWLYSSERKVGDIYQYSTTVVYVLSPAEESTVKTVDVRHILVSPVDSDSSDSASDATKEQWKQAYDKAVKLLNEVKSAKDKEAKFKELAKENTSDSNGDNGGLYENIYPGQMVNSFNTWIFADGRKTGDMDIVKSEYGYHIMYFVKSTDTEAWTVTAETAIEESEHTELIDSYKVKENWFGSRFFEIDTDIDM